MRLEAVSECEHGYTEEQHVYLDELGLDRWCREGGSRREASTTDLIEELKARGAKEIQRAEGTWWSRDVITEGRYLVFSLEGEKP